MTKTPPPVKDPVTPEHKRFVLSQASLRLWIMAAVVVALGAWLIFEL
ncbi:hypothetical protein [Methylopila sp. M107]|nr:hypothetical protein [Methylopila sp. M107]